MKFILTLTLAFLLFTGNVMGQKISQREVYDKIIEAGIQHPVLVLKQALQESYHLKYKRAMQQNNYWGILTNKGNLKYFESVDECIIFYRDRIQSRYKGGDYFRFLRRIGYHDDAHYEKRVNRIKLDFELE